MGVRFEKRPVVANGTLTTLRGAGMPFSGTTGAGVGVQGFANGQKYVDTTNNVEWINEGTSTAPYWSPVSVTQAPLWGIDTDFRHQQTTALSDTTAALFSAGSGLRMFGAGQAQNDGGSINNAAGSGGYTLRMTASATNPGIAAIGTAAAIFVPQTHGGGYVEAEVTQVSAITLRGMAIGFLGATAADNLAPQITAATTVATYVINDLALLHFNVGYTAASRLYTGFSKGGTPATTDFSSATAQDSGTNVAAAGTYQRLRVEFGADGSLRTFINKVQVYSGAAATIDKTVSFSPVLYIESTSAAVKSQDVRRFRFVAHRA